MPAHVTLDTFFDENLRLVTEGGVDVGRECGYKDGSGITQLIKRLEREATEDAPLRARMDALQKKTSSVKMTPMTRVDPYDKAKGGPLTLEEWTAALWKDERVQAAWEVVAEAIYQIEKHKYDSREDKECHTAPKQDASSDAFARFFKDTVQSETVPQGIPPAVAWDDLAAKKKWTSTQLKKTQNVRGKLNVPRERFQQTEEGEFVWAGGKQ